LARAEGYAKQVAALGQQATALVNLAAALAESKTRFVPDVVVAGGGGGSMDGLAGSIMRWLGSRMESAGGGTPSPPPAPHPVSVEIKPVPPKA
jgi:hypothetical protein